MNVPKNATLDQELELPVLRRQLTGLRDDPSLLLNVDDLPANMRGGETEKTKGLIAPPSSPSPEDVEIEEVVVVDQQEEEEMSTATEAATATDVVTEEADKEVSKAMEEEDGGDSRRSSVSNDSGVENMNTSGANLVVEEEEEVREEEKVQVMPADSQSVEQPETVSTTSTEDPNPADEGNNKKKIKEDPLSGA